MNVADANSTKYNTMTPTNIPTFNYLNNYFFFKSQLVALEMTRNIEVVSGLHINALRRNNLYITEC